MCINLYILHSWNNYNYNYNYTIVTAEKYNIINFILINYGNELIYKRTKKHFNKMKKEVGMLLQKRPDTSAVGIYKFYEENTH